MGPLVSGRVARRSVGSLLLRVTPSQLPPSFASQTRSPQVAFSQLCAPTR